MVDYIWQTKYFPEFAAQIDEDLIAHNLPSFQTLYGLVADCVHKVIKRQKIKNIDEYYVIKELIDDTVSDITNDERVLLTKFLADFEMTKTTR